MSVFCAEVRGTVLHRSTATTGVVVRRAPSVGTMPISIMLRFFASRRVLRELRANQLALRSLRGSRQHRSSREVREDREGTRRTATPRVVSPRVQVNTHRWIAKQGLHLDRLGFEPRHHDLPLKRTFKQRRVRQDRRSLGPDSPTLNPKELSILDRSSACSAPPRPPRPRRDQFSRLSVDH